MKSSTIRFDDQSDRAANVLAKKGLGSRSEACRRALVYCAELAEREGVGPLLSCGDYDGPSDDHRTGNYRMDDRETVDENGDSSGPSDPRDRSDDAGDESAEDRMESAPPLGADPDKRGSDDQDGPRRSFLDYKLFPDFFGGEEEAD